MNENTLSSQKGAQKFEKPKGFTAEWLAMRIRDQTEVRAIALLRNWADKSKYDLCTRDLLREINVMPDSLAVKTLKALQLRKFYIRGKHGKQLDVAVTITTLDTARSFDLKALLDTGCTNSCIDRKFV